MSTLAATAARAAVTDCTQRTVRKQSRAEQSSSLSSPSPPTHTHTQRIMLSRSALSLLLVALMGGVTSPAAAAAAVATAVAPSALSAATATRSEKLTWYAATRDMRAARTGGSNTARRTGAYLLPAAAVSLSHSARSLALCSLCSLCSLSFPQDHSECGRVDVRLQCDAELAQRSILEWAISLPRYGAETEQAASETDRRRSQTLMAWRVA